jgi:cation/acetate symporter
VAFVIASAANLPAILFTLFWKRFNTYGAVASLVGGSVLTIWLVAVGPGWTIPVNAHPAFPLQNVGIVAIPVGFALAIIGTYVGELFKADKLAEIKFHEIDVRAQTGIGAEPVPVTG